MITPDNCHLSATVYAEAKAWADQMTGARRVPRTVLACALLHVVEELAIARPAPASVTRESVAETVVGTLAAIAHTLDFDTRARLDALVSRELGA